MGLGLFCGRRYAVGLFAGIAVYAAVAAAVMFVEYSPAVQGVLRVAIGLLPTIPLGFCAVWVAREYRTGDELQKRVTADGVLFAFVVTAVVSLSYGFLQVVVELPVVNATLGWAVMGSAWVVGSLIARRRYR